MEVEIEIIERVAIKPSSPTPKHLRYVELSLLDQCLPKKYTQLLLCYPNNSDDDRFSTISEKSQQLKVSLSETLTRFYPFAGKIKDNRVVDCDDEGAQYVEARVNCLLVDILSNPNVDELRVFHPNQLDSPDQMLKVQASFFKCGGMVISVCILHKLADATTLILFLKVWSAFALKSEESLIPEFNAASLFPPKDIDAPIYSKKLKKDDCITKRFVFDGTKINILKDKVSSATQHQPTRVEVVSALIWKSALLAAKHNSGVQSLSKWSQALNIRKRAFPPLSDYLVGNLITSFMVQTDEKVIELHNLVNKLRKGLQDFCENDYIKNFQGENGSLKFCEIDKELGESLRERDRENYLCSSWCKFPLYDVDFGWGKPKWVASTIVPFKNIILLIDTEKGDGIEAWVTLTPKNMDLFERDEELLSFASLNPSVM